MKFGSVPLDAARGAILVHSRSAGERRLRKGQVLDDAAIAALAAAGAREVVVVELEPADVSENEAAAQLAAALLGPGVRAGIAGTGRVNLFAEAAGLAVIDRARIDAINAVSEAITVATVAADARVAARQIVATVKLIPFAVPEDDVGACVAAAASDVPAVRLAAFRPRRLGLLQTTLPGTRARILEKTVETLARRAAGLGSELALSEVCDHDEAAAAGALASLVAAGADIVLVVGASATADRRDVIPAAIMRAGGTIERFGMPVDPGNLLVLARIDDVPVLALPGSARSPKLGGNDLILERLLAGLPVDRATITAMGVGGLLKEIPSRPLPRAEAAPETTAPPAVRVAAIVLAAGQSRRMGAVNKLLVKIDGAPMVARVVDAVLASGCEPVIVVTGHQPDRLRDALAGRPVKFVYNAAYGEGLSTSLRAGLDVVPAGVDGALIALGDMPRLTPAALGRLVGAFDPAAGRAICVPSWNGKRGNPVLWGRRYFDDMRTLTGDVGARHLIGEYADVVVEVAMNDDAVLVDVDSPAALAALTARGEADG